MKRPDLLPRSRYHIDLDKSQQAATRCQALASYVSNSSEEDIARSFKEHCFVMFQVLLDAWSGYEAIYRRGKSTVGEKDVLIIGEVLKRILKYFPDLVNQGWQVNVFLNLLEKFLFIENVQPVRMMGLQLLLMFLEAVQTPSPFQQELFPTSIDFSCFAVGYPAPGGLLVVRKPVSVNKRKLFVPAPREWFVSLNLNPSPTTSPSITPSPTLASSPPPNPPPFFTNPSAVAPTSQSPSTDNTSITSTSTNFNAGSISSSSPLLRQEASDLFELILRFIGEHIDNFSFWFDLLRNHFLTVLYPDVCRKIGLLTSQQDSGFTAYCPYELQVIFINHLHDWTSEPAIVDFFFCPTVSSSSISDQERGSNLEETNSNTTILLEVLRQAFSLPIKYADVIKKAVHIAHITFFSNLDPSNSLGDGLVVNQGFLFDQLQHVFETDSAGFDKEHESLGQYVITTVYRSLIGLYSDLRPATQQLLLFSLLNMTTALLKKSNSNKNLAAQLGATMVETLLFGWLQSRESDPAMWTTLRTGLEGLFHYLVVVTQLRIKLLQMTALIKEFIYPLSERKAAKKVKDARNFAKAGGEPRSTDYREPIPDVQKDPAIAKLDWSVESVSRVWYCLVDMLLQVNNIKEPSIHEAAILALVEVQDTLLQAEDEMDFADTLDESKPRPLSLVNIFGPRLFEACGLDSKYIKGKAAAYSALCRLFVRHHPQYPIKLLSHFYTVINTGMFTAPISGIDLSWGIINYGSNMFSLALPGADVLIPCYLYRIKALLRSSMSTTPPDVRRRAITILCSLICYPNHLSPIEIPTQMERGKLIGKNLKLAEMKHDLAELLIHCLKADKSIDNKLMSLWGLSVQMMEEITHSYVAGGNAPVNCTGIIKDIFDAIVVQLGYYESLVTRAAVDIISSLALVHAQLTPAFINSILTTLLNVITKTIADKSMIPPTSSVSDAVVATYYHAMLDWVSVKNDLFDNEVFHGFRSLLFQAIQMGLDYGSSEIDSDSKDDLENANSKSGGHLSRMMSAVSRGKGNPSVRSSGGKSSIEEIKDDAASGEHHDQASSSIMLRSSVKDAAEMLLAHVLNFVHNFPPKLGPEVLASQMDETDDRDVVGRCTNGLFFVFNNFTLMSVVPVPKTNGQSGFYARVFVRDLTGKYSWNFELQQNDVDEAVKIIKQVIERNDLPQIFGVKSNESGGPVALESDGPKVQASSDYLLTVLEQNFPRECLPSSGRPFLNPLPFITNNQVIEDLRTAESRIQSYVGEESAQYSTKLAKDKFKGWKEPVPPSTVITDIHHFSRLLVSQLGFLALPRKPHVLLLTPNNKFERALQQLDITSGREILKIGIIYVGEGQDDQKDILKNNQTTALYREFVSGLGWPVDLQVHKGYMGGLDRKLTTGTTAPYYASPTYEVIFHEITRMPTDPKEPQQIHKKRHVGNDLVHTTWSDHVRDYSPTTVTSQFNDAHIVVYPLQNGLFRIQIYRKEQKVPLFGPLLHGMAIPKRLLALLVRQTAMNAYRYVRYSLPGYAKPFMLRKQRIKEIVERYVADSEYHDVLSTVLQPPSAAPASTIPSPAPVPASTSSPVSQES